MPDRVCNVLFLCTGNTARSILAEGILRKDGAGRFNAFSAGSQPKGVVNPLAIKVLGRLGLPDRRLPVEELGRVREARRARRWISSSRSATAPRARPARSGLGIRRLRIGASRIPPPSGKRDRKGARLRPGRQVI